MTFLKVEYVGWLGLVSSKLMQLSSNAPSGETLCNCLMSRSDTRRQKLDSDVLFDTSIECHRRDGARSSTPRLLVTRPLSPFALVRAGH